MNTLIDISDLAKEVGINYPILISEAAYQLYVHWTNDDDKLQLTQTVESRLYNILSMLLINLKSPFQKRSQELNSLRFSICTVPRDGRSYGCKRVCLQAMIGDSDNDQHQIVLMLPDEL